jgi:hypothetical protein
MTFKQKLAAAPALAMAITLVFAGPALAVFNPGQGTPPPGGADSKVNTIVSWIAWLVFAGCLIGVLISAVKLAFERQGFGGGQSHTSLLFALGACIVAASASGLVGALA